MSLDEVLTIQDVAAILEMALHRKDFGDWVERQARARTGKGGPSEP
jgi:hypothetical protein